MARDTAEDWKHIGATEPWWGVLAAPEFLRANITQAAKERFYAQGRSEMAWVIETLTRLFGAFQPQTGVDFGSGLGRLTFPMADVCAHVYGVDVSASMIAEACNQRDTRKISNVTFAHALPHDLRVDWINSYIVMQHIAPRYGYEILSGLLQRLNRGGFISVQLTYAHDRRDMNALLQDAEAYRFDGETMTVMEPRAREMGQGSMYDYDMNRVLLRLVQSGINPITLHATDHGGVHGFWMLGRSS